MKNSCKLLTVMATLAAFGAEGMWGLGSPATPGYRETVLKFVDGPYPYADAKMVRAIREVKEHPELFDDGQARERLQDFSRRAVEIIGKCFEYPQAVPAVVLSIGLLPHLFSQDIVDLASRIEKDLRGVLLPENPLQKTEEELDGCNESTIRAAMKQLAGRGYYDDPDLLILERGPATPNYRETVLMLVDGPYANAKTLRAAREVKEHPELFDDDQARVRLQNFSQWAADVIEDRSGFPHVIPVVVLAISLLSHLFPRDIVNLAGEIENCFRGVLLPENPLQKTEEELDHCDVGGAEAVMRERGYISS